MMQSNITTGKKEVSEPLNPWNPRGRETENGRFLAAYNICDDDLVYLVLRSYGWVAMEVATMLGFFFVIMI